MQERRRHYVELRSQLVWLLAFALGAECVRGVDVVEAGKPYKEYLQEMPPIKRLVFEQSHEGVFGHGFLLADGALQPTGFFLRYLSNSPITTNLLVWGMSSEHEWSYGKDWDNVCYGPAHLATNWNAAMNYYPLERLRTIAYLGFPGPLPETFAWTSHTDFEFQNPWDKFLGRITKFEGNRPVEVEYQSKREDSKFWRKCTIAYDYDDADSFIPSRFVMDLQSRTEDVKITNIIRTLEIGLDGDVANGYHLRDFLPPKAHIATVYFISNRIRFDVRPDGSMTLYKYADEFERGSNAARYSIVFIFLAGLIAAGVYMTRKRGMFTNNSTS